MWQCNNIVQAPFLVETHRLPYREIPTNTCCSERNKQSDHDFKIAASKGRVRQSRYMKVVRLPIAMKHGSCGHRSMSLSLACCVPARSLVSRTFAANKWSGGSLLLTSGFLPFLFSIPTLGVPTNGVSVNFPRHQVTNRPKSHMMSDAVSTAATPADRRRRLAKVQFNVCESHDPTKQFRPAILAGKENFAATVFGQHVPAATISVPRAITPTSISP